MMTRSTVLPWEAFLIPARLSALLRVWTSFSNGAIADQIDITYALGLTVELLDPHPASTAATDSAASLDRFEASTSPPYSNRLARGLQSRCCAAFFRLSAAPGTTVCRAAPSACGGTNSANWRRR